VRRVLDDAIIICRVNGTNSAEVFDDDPIRFSIEMLSVAGKTFRTNLPSAGWSAFIRILLFSPSSGTWVDTNWNLKLLMRYMDKQTIEFDPSSPLVVDLGMDPKDVKLIPRGPIQVRALARLSASETLQSNAVQLNHIAERGAPISPESELRRVRFYLDGGQYAEARTAALKILVRDPHSIEALELMGDVSVKMGDMRAGLDFFRGAFNEFNKQYPSAREPPQLLLSKIDVTQDRILNP